MAPQDFVQAIINGPTGFKAYEEHEWVVYPDREVAIAEFVFRCLANVNCEGSQDILDTIRERREQN